MTVEESYQELARLLDYPMRRDRLVGACQGVESFLQERGQKSPLAPFAELLHSSTLAELQEDYVAQFDFNPAAAPYLGHHLFGDNQKKGAYLIQVKQAFLRHGFEPEGCELPDHLPVLLGFLAHLARKGAHEERRYFIDEMVRPGLEKLLASWAPRGGSPWLTLFAAAGLLLSADCEEVPTC